MPTAVMSTNGYGRESSRTRHRDDPPTRDCLAEIEAALTSIAAWSTVPVDYAVATVGADVGQLAPGERAQLERIRSVRRRHDWRLGRAALKALLRRFGENDDTSRLRFPHARYSLTHAGDCAIAVGSTGRVLRGIGVDFEVARRPSRGTGPFFLTSSERAWLETKSRRHPSWHMVRLWTAKEAVFKACFENSGTTLLDYTLLSPAANSGWAHARRAPAPGLVRYVTRPVPLGFIAFAETPAVQPARAPNTVGKVACRR
jgi:4'-phosphopantetheinyl transferase EntD